MVYNYFNLRTTPFNNLNLLICHPIEIINKPVNLRICRINSALNYLFFIAEFCTAEFFVEFKHLLDEGHHLVMFVYVFGVGQYLRKT